MLGALVLGNQTEGSFGAIIKLDVPKWSDITNIVSTPWADVPAKSEENTWEDFNG